MKRVFLDSSVLFSAAYSPTGGSRELILMAARGELVIVLSQLVLEETRRNLAASAPESVVWLDVLVEALPIELVRPSRAEVVDASAHVALKDAPIVAAAKMATVDLLVTLDKKHILGKPGLEGYVGARIVTPKDGLAILHETD